MTLTSSRQLDNAFCWIEGDVVTPDRPRRGVSRYRGRAPTDRRYGVATLEEVAITFPGVLLKLDIKGTVAAGRALRRTAGRSRLRRLDLGRDRVIVASFPRRRHSAVSHATRPGVATSAATNETAAFFVPARSILVVPPVVAFQVPARFGEIDVVTESFLDAAHAAGIAVHVWTINEQEEMARLVDLGVDGLVSDRPSVLAARSLREQATAGGMERARPTADEDFIRRRARDREWTSAGPATTGQGRATRRGR